MWLLHWFSFSKYVTIPNTSRSLAYDYSRNLKETARKNGVVLTGFIKGKKLHSLLTNCLCYCRPSSHEGLPIALLEAMSYQDLFRVCFPDFIRRIARYHSHKIEKTSSKTVFSYLLSINVLKGVGYGFSNSIHSCVTGW